MGRKEILLLATMGVALVVVLAACGGESSTTGEETTAASGGEPYSVAASAASLKDAGWEATETEGVGTYAEVQEVGYLEATAPDGEPIDLQFLESPEDAQSELSETAEQEPPFEGATIGNVLVFDPDTETAAPSPENLEALRELLR